MKIKITIFVNIMMIGCYFGSGFAMSEFVPGYGSAIGWKVNQIKNNFINISSGVVAKERLFLSDEFKNFLYTDKLMQKIKKINTEGTTEATLDVTVLEENIDAYLKYKEDELGAARDGCSLKQKGCFLLAGAGIIGALSLVTYANTPQAGGNKVALHGAGAAVCLATVGTAVGLSYIIGKEKDFEQHIKQVQAMRKEWKAFFAVYD